MSTTLTAAERAEICQQLSFERDAILEQVGTLALEDAELATARVSQEERAKSQGDADLIGVERDVVARQTQSLRATLHELEDALARLEAGTYGACAMCGRDIPAARLVARPRATTCVGCAARR